MALIHNSQINLLIRSILSPFKKLIPAKFHFAINGKVIISMPEGKRMIFYANPTSPLLRELFWYGPKGFEYDELQVFTALAKKSSVFFDIGANIGYYSIVAKLYNSDINVHAFEPLPGARIFARKNADANGFSSIKINEIAISDKNGEEAFHSRINPKFKNFDIQLNGDSSLFPGRLTNSELKKFNVTTQTLDSYVEANLDKSMKIDLIKMDTEGTEDRVLKAATKVLKEHRPIIMCEVIVGGIEKEVEHLIAEHDYLFYSVHPKGLKKVKDLSVEIQRRNFFFVPREKESLVKELTF